MSPAPKVTPITVRAMDHIGSESAPFIQGMLNRLAIGAIRYGRNEPSFYRENDMVATARRRLAAAVETNDRDLLIDAANFCLLAWLHLPPAPPDGGGDSPGVVRADGTVWGARGRWADENGTVA